MNTSTLISKVLLPRRREDVLTRQRLLDRLYDMVDRKLVLVSAPAGYGKTTLLVDFAYDLEHPVCWYALDGSDRDPRIFLEHLILSLHHCFPDFDERTRQALATNPDLANGAPSVVNVLINEMVDVIPRWFVLVLDDYHRLGKAPEVGHILARLLSYQTGQFLLIITSRTVPELPIIIQLTARGEIDGLGQEDLRFRADEIQRLLAQNYNLHIPGREAEELAAQSEGWITGILLTTQTVWRGILESLVQARISDQPVYEYLAQEVFAQQEPPLQSFLMASSTLQEMSPALCQEVLGLEEAKHFLALLEDRNLFVTRLDEDWYRYHHLFQEYLQVRLRREEESRWVELHRRAANWFETHERPEEAVYHYVTVGAYEDAAQVMEAAAQGMFYAGRLETLTSWGAALPSSLGGCAPRLALFQSRAADMLGRWEEALALAQVAERGYRARQDTQGLAYALLLRCQVWQQQGRFQETLSLGQQVVSLIEETGVPVAYEAHRILGMSCLGLGQLEEAEAHLRQALETSLEQGGDFERSSVQMTLGGCLWRQGRWAEAVAVQRQAVAIRRRLGNPAALSGTLNDLGFFLYLTGEYGEALHLFEEALELARRSGHRRNETLTLLSLAELTRDLGALEQAIEACEEGLAIADELGDGFLSAYGREALGLVHCRRGDYPLAQAAIEQAIERAEQQHSEYQLGRYQASLGLVRAEAGEVEAGLADLALARERLKRIGAHSELARAQFFTAWALFQAGRGAEALVLLQEALATVNGPSREHLFVVEGQRAFPLLKHAQAQGVGGEELAVLLALAQAFEQNTQAVLRQVSLPESVAEESLRIFGFGRGRVERGGEEIPSSDWVAAAPRQMLFYLLTHPSRSREQVAAALWPELPARKVKATFHTTKFRINRALGREAACFDGGCYDIHPDLNYWFDVAEFERLLEGTSSGRRVVRLQQAVALYQGDFLEDCYADWCLPIRERLRGRCLEALGELAERLLMRRQYRQAIQVLRRGLAMDDLQEKFHRQLMRAYTLSGRRSEALVQYKHCSEILERELGVGPSPETTTLYHRILEGLPLD